MDFRRLRGPWAVAILAGLVATALIGVGVSAARLPGPLDVFLEPAGAAGPDPFLVLDSPDLRVGEAERLALSGGVTIRTGIEPGLYGGSGSDHLCDPRLIADFLAQDASKAEAWASAAGIGVDEIDSFLDTLTPVRLRADTWVTNHGYREGQATPRQSILQAGSMVLIDEFGVPRVRCKCGNPLLPSKVPTDRDRVEYVGEPWDDFDPDRVLVIEPGDRPVESFILVRLEDGHLIARPVGTTGDEDVLVDEDGNWIPELDLALPPTAAAGDGPFALPDVSSAGLDVEYQVDGRCRVGGGQLILEGSGLCTVSARSEAEDPWAALAIDYAVEVVRLDQEIMIDPIETVVLSEGAIPLGVVTDSLLPVEIDTSGPCRIEGDELTPTGPGICELVVTQPGDARWAPAEPVTLSIEIVDGPPRQAVSIRINLPRSVRLDEGPVSLRATTSPTRPVVYAVAGACTLLGRDDLHPTGIGRCTVQAVAAGDDDFQRAVASATVAILPRRQTLGLDTVPRSIVLSDTAVPLPATSSTGMVIDYEVSGACRLGPEGLELTSVGTCQVVASAGGDAETEPATASFEITVTAGGNQLQAQTITFIQPGSLVFKGPGATLSATADSGLPVTLTVTEGTCQLRGSTLLPGDVGRCTVVASQPGDARYQPAPPVTRRVSVGPLTPTLTLRIGGGSATEVVGGESRTVTATVSAGPSAAIMATDGPCTATGSDTIVASRSTSGLCQITVATSGDGNHSPVSDTISIRVKQTQTVSVGLSPRSIFVDQGATLEASASSQLALSLSATPSSVCVLSDNQVLGIAPGTCTITAAQGGNDDYAAASGSASLQIVPKRTPTVSIAAPASATVGETFPVNTDSSEPNVTITVRAAGAACQDQGGGLVVAVARGTCTITATHPETSEAQAGSAQATVNITGFADRVRFDCIGPCDIQVGQQVAVAIVSESRLDLSASVTGPCTIVDRRSGSTAGYLEVTVQGDSSGPCTLTGSTSGSAEFEPAANTQPITVRLIPTSLQFSLGKSIQLGQQRTYDVVHDIPAGVVQPGVSSSEACSAFIDPAGRTLTVEAVSAGTCTVTVTVSGGNYAKASATDSAVVAILR